MKRLERPFWAAAVIVALLVGNVSAAASPQTITLHPGDQLLVTVEDASPSVPATAPPSPTPTTVPTPTTPPTPTPSPVATPSPTPVPTPAPTSPPPSSPAPSPTPSPLAPILLSSADLAALPTTGAAWDAVVAAATATWPAPDLTNQDSKHQLNVLAAALDYGRTGDAALRAKARDGIAAALPTFNATTTNGVLSLGRQLAAYVIAADVIGLRTFDPALDATFRSDLAAWRDGTVGTHGRWAQLGFTYGDSSNNWGAHAGTAVIAIDRYLGNDLSADWAIFKGYAGDRTSHQFPIPSIAQPTWYVASQWSPVQVAPGDPRDGAVTEDAWRNGAYPTLSDTYVMDSAQALGLQAEMLAKAGYPAWSKLAGSSDFLKRQASPWTTTGGRGGRSLAFLYNARIAGYNVSTANVSDRMAWSLGFMDWLYGGAIPTPTPTPVPTPSPTPVPTPSPTPVPTPTPTPVPTPSPTPVPTPSPTPGDPFAVPFGSRPASGPINLTGAACNGITISNKTFADLGAGVRAITLTNCTNVVIEQVDFINVAEGVIAHGGSNITVRDSRYKNIIGPAHDSAGKRTTNMANFVQFDNTDGAHVIHNKGKCGDTEDIVSFTGSTKNSNAEDNQFEGGDGSPGCLSWVSNSGSGIAVADGSATNNFARNNIVLNPGQVGIFINGGTNSKIDNNIIVGQQRPLSNRPSYISGASTCAAEASGNRARWYDKNNNLLGLYTSGGCVPVQSGNSWTDTTLDPNAYHVQL